MLLNICSRLKKQTTYSKQNILTGQGLNIEINLTLKAPITPAADNKFCDIFPNFQKKLGMLFHENRLLADDSHPISCLICYFLKKQQNLKLSSAANYRWRFKG